MTHGRSTGPASPAKLQASIALREALTEAIRRDDAAEVESLVLRGAPLHDVYYHRTLPLASSPSAAGFVTAVDWAALELRFRAAMQILELGDVRAVATHDRDRNTLNEYNLAAQTRYAVSAAARYGHLGLLRLLLERSASIDQRDEEQRTPLHLAALGGHRDAATLLLQSGAWQQEEQQAAILELVHDTVLASLFTFVATASEVSGQLIPVTAASVLPVLGGMGRPHTSSSQGGRSCSGILEVGAPADGTALGLSSWGWAPLGSSAGSALSAASGGAVALPRPGAHVPVEELGPAAVRLRGELRRTICKGDVEKLSAYIVRGAPLEASFDLGHVEQGTCVDLASVAGQPAAALALLRLADARGLGDALVTRSRAALSWSVVHGQLEVLQELLQRRADVGSRRGGEKAESLLAQAVLCERPEEAQELLRHGAWELESEEEQAQLRVWVQSRKRMDLALPPPVA